ncbi:hypothetical protein M9H77_28518 [Catharanthus roseus]|uniref:Uncharacterized protein n=1 Tax=Catharanthus roseus TaxID=4058 RepID=A0ACC0AFT5_CATRO|nr:hypothetical protein M9H77_28518 [Catharanthus roseus]
MEMYQTANLGAEAIRRNERFDFDWVHRPGRELGLFFGSRFTHSYKEEKPKLECIVPDSPEEGMMIRRQNPAISRSKLTKSWSDVVFQELQGLKDLSIDFDKTEYEEKKKVAGYGVGALLLCATISATKVDSLIASSQRSSIGICKRCGDLRLIACTRCRGSGLIAGPGQLIVGSVPQSFIVKPRKTASISCSKCQARGHFSCPNCSKALN